MVDIPDPNQAARAEKLQPTLGQVLARARQVHGLSIEQVGHRLRIESHFVQALEDERFDVFAAPVFVRGYLRQLADLLDLEGDDLLARYAVVTDAAEPSVTHTRPVTGSRRAWAVRLRAALILLLVALAFWFTWVNRDWVVNFLTLEQRATIRSPEALVGNFTHAEGKPAPGVAESPVRHTGADEWTTLPFLSMRPGRESRPPRDGWRILPRFSDEFE